MNTNEIRDTYAPDPLNSPAVLDMENLIMEMADEIDRLRAELADAHRLYRDEYVRREDVEGRLAVVVALCDDNGHGLPVKANYAHLVAYARSYRFENGR